MKNKELFDKTIGILVNAYMKGTLYHSDARCCAVGNLVMAHNNYRLKGMTWVDEQNVTKYPDWYSCGAVKSHQLDGLGYSLIEVIEIEKAFEHFDWGDDDITGYKGLMSVVDALIDIHQGTDTQKTEAKEMFKIEL